MNQEGYWKGMEGSNRDCGCGGFGRRGEDCRRAKKLLKKEFRGFVEDGREK